MIDVKEYERIYLYIMSPRKGEEKKNACLLPSHPKTSEMKRTNSCAFFIPIRREQKEIL